MGKIALAFVVLLLLALVGGGVFLAFFELPAPSRPVEKVIPDARLPR